MPYKYLFFDDYSEGAHPRILEAFSRTNSQQEPGYVMDSFAVEAAGLIRDAVANPEADVHFVSSGTQANLVVLASLLRPYESVIAADSGHINVRETGAVEATGHKIHTVEATDGKLTPEAIRKIVEAHNFEQMVIPRAVYISQSTEVGTIYNRQDLEDLSKTCGERGLYLYVDGARLGAALASPSSDLDIETLASLTDVFFIGGTKNGALIGEAIVIVNPALKENFRYHLRQRGALLAKGRAVSLQFRELFTDNLYFEIAAHANAMAQKLAQGIKECGYRFLVDSPTNQVFPILPKKVVARLQADYGFHVWADVDSETSVIRLITSWATPQKAVEGFLHDLKQLS
jgi:threonine aldolase